MVLFYVNVPFICFHLFLAESKDKFRFFLLQLIDTINKQSILIENFIDLLPQQIYLVFIDVKVA